MSIVLPDPAATDGQLTRKQIVDMVLADRFATSQRGDATNWVDLRYWQLWNAAAWTFKQATVTVQAEVATQALDTPADLRAVLGLFTETGDRLRWLDPAEFDNRYLNTGPGGPCHFTIIAGTILVGPAPTADALYQLLYEREYTPLTNDNQVPLLPAGSHIALVYGAAADGLLLQQDPGAAGFEQRYQQIVTLMQQQYLVDSRGDSGSYRRAAW